MTPEQKRLKKEADQQIEDLWAYVEAVLSEREKQQQKTQPS